MKSKETKIDIEVNIYGCRFTVKVPFSRQDAVRATETQMRAYLKGLLDTHSRKNITECMAMMAYHYASNFFAMNAQRESEAAEAEELLKAAGKLCGDPDYDEGTSRSAEYGEF